MIYKVLFVDWDGTLSNSRFWHRWIGTKQYELIQRVLFTEGQELLCDWMTGSTSFETVLKYIESRTNIPYKDLREELIYSAEHMQFIDQQVVEIIQKLREKGVKVVIATDNMDVFRHQTVSALQLDQLFDGILVSDVRGALKSHFHEDGTSKFFHHYLSQNDIKAEDTALIDNSLNAKVVESFGINFLHVNDNSSLRDYLEKILANR